MDQKIWGPHVWKAMHYIALGYPDEPTKEQKKDYKKFYTLLSKIIPCKPCRDHYTENLKKNPISNNDLKSKSNLVKWTINLHNIVNEQLGKPYLSYDDAMKEFKSFEVCYSGKKWKIKKK